MSHSKQPWLIRYHYDPLDQITSHTLSSTLTRHRFYCKNRLATEIQGAVGYSIVQHDDLLLAQQQHQQDAHDTTVLATDLQRSVLHTFKKDTQPEPIAYSPYGHRSALATMLSLLGFNGERPDPVTGGYLLGNGYRAFNPVLMRFNSPDSLSPFERGGLNAYTYCVGDPINRSDQDGHASLPLRVTLQLAIKARKITARRMANSIFEIPGIPGRYKLKPGVPDIQGARMRSHIQKQLHRESTDYLFDQKLLADLAEPKKTLPEDVGNIDTRLQNRYLNNKHKIVQHIYEKDHAKFPFSRGVFSREKLFNAQMNGPLRNDARKYVEETWHNPIYKNIDTPSQKTIQLVEAYFIRVN